MFVCDVTSCSSHGLPDTVIITVVLFEFPLELFLLVLCSGYGTHEGGVNKELASHLKTNSEFLFLYD